MVANYKNIKILVIDDEKQVLDLIGGLLKEQGFDVYEADSGEEGMELFRRENPTLILTDINIPDLSGIEILKMVKKASPTTQVIVFSGVGTTDNIIKALRLGASDYIMKPFNVGLLIHNVSRCIERHELIMERIGRQKTLKKVVRDRTAALATTFYETVKALGLLTEKRDPYTAGHQDRVALLSVAIGRKLGLTEKELKVIHVAGLLHDIGKVAVPVELLAKPSKLTDPETQLIKSHPQAGFDIIKDIPFVKSLGKDVSIIVLQHHERLDGSGYPGGLKDDDLELETKILSLSDVVEAMSSHRPYRAALNISTTKAEIIKGNKRLYSPECVDACLQIIEENDNDIIRLFDLTAKTGWNNL
jgi:response regulator RpfG family c-di-GMP phosphodiesterase